MKFNYDETRDEYIRVSNIVLDEALTEYLIRFGAYYLFTGGEFAEGEEEFLNLLPLGIYWNRLQDRYLELQDVEP